MGESCDSLFLVKSNSGFGTTNPKLKYLCYYYFNINHNRNKRIEKEKQNILGRDETWRKKERKRKREI